MPVRLSRVIVARMAAHVVSAPEAGLRSDVKHWGGRA